MTSRTYLASLDELAALRAGNPLDMVNGITGETLGRWEMIRETGVIKTFGASPFAKSPMPRKFHEVELAPVA
jgi:hypothetical protein